MDLLKSMCLCWFTSPWESPRKIKSPTRRWEDRWIYRNQRNWWVCVTHTDISGTGIRIPLKRKKPNDLLKLIYVMLKDIKSGKDWLMQIFICLAVIPHFCLAPLMSQVRVPGAAQPCKKKNNFCNTKPPLHPQELKTAPSTSKNNKILSNWELAKRFAGSAQPRFNRLR